MAYALVVEQVETSLEDYRKVMDVVGDRGAGHLVHAVCEIDGGLRFIDIWESREAAERFQFEKLFPAFQQVFGKMPQPGRMDAGETAVLDISR